MRLPRRRLLLAAGAFVAAGCDSRQPNRGFLGAMERFNAHLEARLFRPTRLAPDPGTLSPPGAFPPYYISDEVPLQPSNWVLAIGGLIARPARLSVADLQRLPRTDLRVRHHCVEGWSAVAAWHGVALRELARLVRPDPRAVFVEFRSFDSGYWSSWDLDSALHPQTILAYGMNGGPLLRENGAPLRLYSAVKLGYKMVKYLTEVNFLPERSGGYWEDQGYEWHAGV